MTRGCIRGAGIESLERRGRAGVTNQLWESRLEKTHPLFSPQRERERAEEQIRQTSSGQNHYKWMAITKKYQAGREGKQRSTRLLPHAASYSAPFSFFNPGSNKCDRGKCIRLGGYLSSPAHSSLCWWIAGRLKANVNLVNTANTQKIPLSTRKPHAGKTMWDGSLSCLSECFTGCRSAVQVAPGDRRG